MIIAVFILYVNFIFPVPPIYDHHRANPVFTWPLAFSHRNRDGSVPITLQGFRLCEALAHANSQAPRSAYSML
jgi:hypothetical protein